MRLLAIDTALAACSAAVFDTERGLLAHESIAMTRGHAEALTPMIARVMEAAQMPFAELDRVAVTVGPGSFTGLRVGVSAARGIALAARKPAVAVITTMALAAPWLASDDNRPVLVAIDARNDMAYLQVFSESGKTLLPAQLSPLASLSLLKLGPMTVVGSAARRAAALFPPERIERVDDAAAPDIVWVAKIGATAPTDQPPKPYYLGAPGAKPQARSTLLRA
jgi:tRNA threonylcarbamoyl adenosine modification protein YeaZ